MKTVALLVVCAAITNTPVAMSQQELDGCAQPQTPSFIENLLQLNPLKPTGSYSDNCNPQEVLENRYVYEELTDSVYRLEFHGVENLTNAKMNIGDESALLRISEATTVTNIDARTNSSGIETLKGFKTIQQ